MLDLKDIERKVFNLIASAIQRFLPLNKWKHNGNYIDIPLVIDSPPDKLYLFECNIDIPSTNFKWFLKFVISGNALLKVDGKFYAGIDEYHTYVPIEPGGHRLELVISPRSLFGYHTWSLYFGKAFAVEVSWDIVAFSLQILELLRFTESLPREDPLRKDLEDLLIDVFKNVWITPNITQITLAISLLYEHSFNRYTGRGDLREPYGDYVWLSGVYGLGILKGYLQDIQGPKIDEVFKVYKDIKEKINRGLEVLRKKHGKHGLLLIAGHSHIDAAWLWPRNETVEKVIRTISTVTRLAKEYNFIYLQSSAQYFKWLEDKNRELFEEVKKLVKNNKVLPVGGMWVESDTQLIDGESIVRQFLYGQRYFLNKFNKLCKIGWIPDSFGFSGNLPQIMKLSSIEVFVTHKVMWNDTNEFPYHTFTWRGIDGTEIPVQILILTYNGVMTPKEVGIYWEKYRQKDVVPFTVYIYGYGDGGGGPTREMLEYISLVNSIPRLPTVIHINEEEYIRKLKEYAQKAPRWDGELYLETHRGTYTTNILVKEFMAKAEIALKEAEILVTILQILGRIKLDKQRLDKLWKYLLFNQFHDIVPGSSIKEVYDDAIKDLMNVINEVENIVRENITLLENSNKENLVAFNPLPWARKEIVKIEKNLGVPALGNDLVECQEVDDGYYVYIETPPLGYQTYRLVKNICTSSQRVKAYVEGENHVIENNYIKLVINSNGDISSIKLLNKDVEILGAPSNKLVAYIDLPGKWDAWDIKDYFLDQGNEFELVKAPVVSVKGGLVSCVDIAKQFRSSVVEQRICLNGDSPIVEVKNRIRWIDKGILAKVWFTVNANKTKAFYDIPYGVIERPTTKENSWEKAKFEVPALRWATIYGEEKGLTIIAPSRHGYSAIGNRLGLSLIRSPVYPNPWSDIGEFEVAYYIYPHLGDYQEANVPKVTQQILHKVKVFSAKVEGKISLMCIEPVGLVLGAFKVSEDLDGYVFRIYNPYKEEVKSLIRFSKHLNISKILEINAIETEVYREIPIKDNIMEINLEPQKIKTLKILLNEKH
ncbi:MAG: glycoside hydrolase family 38 C-terminal domain-containing protein [Ignisphaera sp.]